MNRIGLEDLEARFISKINNKIMELENINIVE